MNTINTPAITDIDQYQKLIKLSTLAQHYQKMINISLLENDNEAARLFNRFLVSTLEAISEESFNLTNCVEV